MSEKKQIRELAEPLVEKNVSVEEIEKELGSRGFDSPTIASVVNDLLEARVRALQEDRTEIGLWYRIAGGVMMLLGCLLVAGNRLGFFPTFSFAGTMTIMFGLVLFVVGPRVGRSA